MMIALEGIVLYCDVEYDFYTKKILEQLPKGVFLNTRNGSIANTMTIGWGNIGRMWERPIFTVSIRPTSFSCGLIDETGEFTISVPVERDFSDELALCGQTTGKNTDKFLECDLLAMNSKTLNTIIVGDCKLHCDCKVVMKSEVKAEAFPERLGKVYYEHGNYHKLYFAEIVSAYIIK